MEKANRLKETLPLANIFPSDLSPFIGRVVKSNCGDAETPKKPTDFSEGFISVTHQGLEPEPLIQSGPGNFPPSIYDGKTSAQSPYTVH